MIKQKIYTVAEVTRTIKTLLEENIPTLWIEGEVSNFRPHYSGHLYFTIKDNEAQISVVMWSSRAARLPFALEDGLKVQALGNIRVFDKAGRYQIDVIKMQPVGIGRLQMEFERLKQKLEAEGLFDAEHKKQLPAFPENIGLITSPTGAAIRDMINVLRRRAPHISIIIRPAQVQGGQAASDIAQAIRDFNEPGMVDVIIAGRGGGSIEDLWAFNEELVARAIYESHIPVISAVGHEIDFTIADFVADLRAPTPSAAAELAVPDYLEIKSWLLQIKDRITMLIQNKIVQLQEKVNNIQRSYGLKKPEDSLRQYAQQLDMIVNRLYLATLQNINRNKQVADGLQVRLDNVSPENTLKRGYSLAYQNEKLITSVKTLNPERRLKTKFYDGEVISIVQKKEGEH